MSYLRSARDDITYCQSPGCQEEVAVRQVQTPNGAVNRQRSQWCLKRKPIKSLPRQIVH